MEKQKEKQIAFLGIKDLPSKAGVDRVVEAIIQKIDKRHYHPVVYCSHKTVPQEVQVPGVTLVRIPTLRGKHLHALSLFLLSALHSLWFGNYDLIHVHNVEATFVVPLLRLRYKVISTSHGTAQKLDKWNKLAKTLIRLTEYPYIYLSNVVTSVSQPLAKHYQNYYRRPVHYLPNGVDPELPIDLAGANEILQTNHIQPGNFILFAAGRIMATKGCHLLLEAFQNLHETRQLAPDMQLVVVGDASHEPAYQRKLQQFASQRVCFVPFIRSKATLFGLACAARLFVYPSMVEAMSMMLLEAAAVGAPILCSDIPENVSILPEQALFFHAGNVQDLQQKMCWALQNPEQMSALGRKAQTWVQEQYGWSNIVKQYENLYATV